MIRKQCPNQSVLFLQGAFLFILSEWNLIILKSQQTLSVVFYEQSSLLLLSFGCVRYCTLLILLSIWQNNNPVYYSFSVNKSGRRCCVLCTACSWRHSSIFFKLPLNKISGTFQPLKSAGRV
jgi:hypothetical protein